MPQVGQRIAGPQGDVQQPVRRDVRLAEEDAAADRIEVDAAGAVAPEEEKPPAPLGVGNEDPVRGAVVEPRAVELARHVGENGTPGCRIEGDVRIERKPPRLDVISEQRLRVGEHAGDAGRP